MNDDADKLKVIMGLMEDLQDKMQYGKDDLAERLGRKAPDVAVMKIEGKVDPMMMGKDGEDKDPMGKMLAGSDDDSMGDDDYPSEDEQMSPEDMLKQRLMKMRG